MTTNYEIISQDEVSKTEVLEIVQKRMKEGEPTYREEKIEEFLKKHTYLSKKQFEEAKEAIKGLQIPRLEEKHIIKILDMMPKTGTQLRAIIGHSGVVLVDENANKILDTLKQFKK